MTDVGHGLLVWMMEAAGRDGVSGSGWKDASQQGGASPTALHSLNKTDESSIG